MTLQQLLVYAGILFCSNTIYRFIGINEISIVTALTVLIGCLGLNLHNNISHVASEAFVVFTMYTMGTHMSTEKIWTHRVNFVIAVFFNAVLFVIFYIVLTIFLDLGLKNNIMASVLLMTSSTPIANQLLITSGDFSSSYGQFALVNLVLQDLCLILILGLHANNTSNTITSIFKMIVQLVIAFFIRESNLHKTIKNIYTLIFIMVLCFCIFDYFGVNYEFAAFLIGISFPKKQIIYIIEHINSILIYIFLISSIKVYTNITLKTLTYSLAIFVFVYLIKLMCFFIMSRTSNRLSSRIDFISSVKLGCVLVSSNELTFFIFGEQHGENINIFCLAALINIFTSPILFSVVNFIERVFAKEKLGFAIRAVKKQMSYVEEKVVIVGFGQVGQELYQQFETNKIVVIAIDNDVKKAYKGHINKKRVFFMDCFKAESYYAAYALGKRTYIISTFRDLKRNIDLIATIRGIQSECIILIPCINHADAITITKAGGTPMTIDHAYLSRFIFDFCVDNLTFTTLD